VAVLEGRESERQAAGSDADDSDEDEAEKARRRRRRASLDEIEQSKAKAALAGLATARSDGVDVKATSDNAGGPKIRPNLSDEHDIGTRQVQARRFGLSRKRRLRILEKVLAVGRQVMKQRRAMVRKVGGNRRTRRGNQRLIRQVFTEILGRAPADLAFPFNASFLPSAILRSGHLGLGVRGDPDGLAAQMMTGRGTDQSAESTLRARLDGMDDFAALRGQPSALHPTQRVKALQGGTRGRSGSADTSVTTVNATGIAGSPIGGM